ncbi:EamA family transporter [candidate division WOR-3 bacterium JGI_Cruoil_03_44_89]|uniref:EamA family transporter n=1 Tax=candidate division WOR-3 bacterium JGI_Cruoil_03_44_89 TaxID=1973748 RepID=A0A235C137_UNCW3|nr:MAG: EamA family transporter [candidate division WOR-3 bacterium JGI_Cruoil_03_44_89]
MEKQRLAYTYAIIAVLLWSTVASAFKISLRYLDSLQLLFFASITSVVILFIILLIQKKFALFKKYSKKDYLHSALLAFLNPFLYYVVLFKAYSLLPAQEAQPLNYTWPIMLVLLSIPLLKQKIKFKSILAITISFVGVIIIGTRGNLTSLKFSNPQGVLLAVGSSVIWALFWIYNMKDKRDETAKLFLNFLFGSVFISIAILSFSKIVIPPINGLLSSIYVGLFEMGITFLVWLKALKLSKTTARVSNLIFLAPFISLIFIHRIVGEKILFSTIVGLILIVTGIITQQYKIRLDPTLSNS